MVECPAAPPQLRHAKPYPAPHVTGRGELRAYAMLLSGDQPRRVIQKRPPLPPGTSLAFHRAEFMNAGNSAGPARRRAAGWEAIAWNDREGRGHQAPSSCPRCSPPSNCLARITTNHGSSYPHVGRADNVLLKFFRGSEMDHLEDRYIADVLGGDDGRSRKSDQAQSSFVYRV